MLQYLGFASAVELDELDWFERNFPEDLQLRHAYHVFQLLPAH